MRSGVKIHRGLRQSRVSLVCALSRLNCLVAVWPVSSGLQQQVASMSEYDECLLDEEPREVSFKCSRKLQPRAQTGVNVACECASTGQHGSEDDDTNQQYIGGSRVRSCHSRRKDWTSTRNLYLHSTWWYVVRTSLLIFRLAPLGSEAIPRTTSTKRTD